MATAKAIKKRRKTAQNIHKITKTMELVATAKLKSATQRFNKFKRYHEIAQGIMARIAGSGIEHPLLEQREQISHATLFVIMSSKGLCGNYNARLAEKVLEAIEQNEQRGQNLSLHVVGRKGIQLLQFRKIIMEQGYSDFPDQPPLPEVEKMADNLMNNFKKRKTDNVSVLHMENGRMIRETLLPYALPEQTSTREEQYLYSPDSETLLAEILPQFCRLKLFGIFLRSAISEQTSRMMAMKMATENAEDMIKRLTREYNRARQSQITNEILEILSGANAL